VVIIPLTRAFPVWQPAVLRVVARPPDRFADCYLTVTRRASRRATFPGAVTSHKYVLRMS